MIGYLRGTVQQRFDQQIILLVQGVGYLVRLGNDLISTLADQQEAELFISTQVREDDIALYGFADRQQLEVFELLLGVSGIGAKTAMAVLDLPLDMIARAIEEEDERVLCQVPGLGKKTASRLILELKGKLDVSTVSPEGSSPTVPRSLQEEALQALESLGYDKPSIIRFLNSTDKSYDSAEEVVRAFLQHA